MGLQIFEKRGGKKSRLFSSCLLLKYGSHTIKLSILKVYNYGFRNIQKVVYESPHQIPENFHYPQINAVSFSNHSHSHFTSVPVNQPIIYFVSIDFPIMDISWRKHILCHPLCLAFSFTIMFSVALENSLIINQEVKCSVTNMT